MLRTGTLQIVAIAVVGVMWTTAEASVLRSMSLAELANQADDIVVAKVVSVAAAWDPTHRRILSTIEADVEDTWKGDATTRHVTIVQPGGTVGDIEMTVYGMPTFSVAERALLFLQRSAQRRVVVGMSEGKRPLRWNSVNNQWLVDGPDLTNAVEVAPNGRFRRTVVPPPLQLDTMHAQIRALVDGK